MTIAALIGMLIAPAVTAKPSWIVATMAILAALTGLVEGYFAIRVGVDAALFHQLAKAPEGGDVDAIDSALARLHMLPPAKQGRSVAERIAGARHLFGCQIVALGLQVLSILVGASISWTWR
jgi:hypothetical protein